MWFSPSTSNLPTGLSGIFGIDLAPNADDLSVLPGPPAIDAGTALNATFNQSINSLPGPQGNAWDIGAYEFP